jgi:hypothetical protein
MRVSLYFGLSDTPIKFDWNKKIEDFPKVVNYSYRNWEFNMYKERGLKPYHEYDLYFGELKTYDPRALKVHPTLIEIMGNSDKSVCDCGGLNNPGSGGHWNFCKIWSKP